MPMEPERVEIGERVFWIQHMDAFTALKIAGDLQRDLLPAIAPVLSRMQPGSDLAGATDEAAVAAAIQKAAMTLDGEGLKRWYDRLVTPDRIAVEVNGQPTRLTPALREQAFDDFVDVLELMFHVIRIDLAGPLARGLKRIGLAQRLSPAGLSASTPTNSLPN